VAASTHTPSRPLAYVGLVAILAFLAWAYLPNRPNPPISQAPTPESSRSRSEPVTVLGHQEEMAKAGDDARPPALGPSLATPPPAATPKPPSQTAVQPSAPVPRQNPRARAEAPPSTLTPIPEAEAETDDFEANDPHPTTFIEPRRTTLEVVPEPLIKRVWDRVPGVRRLQKNYRGGDGYQPPTAGRQVSPSFPVGLRQSLKASSPLVIRLNVDDSGRVQKAKVLTKRVDPRVRDFALDAVKRWRFRPAKLEGRAISSRVNVVFQF
jgi:periplasmic protein TonB